MDSSKFLIIGANGQLGKALQKQYPDAQAVDSDTLDISDKAAVKTYDWSRVTHILNAAAYTNVDGAETAEGRSTAWAVNAQAPAYLTQIATQNDLTIVHISTDYVFDGTNNNHSEDEMFTPLSVYGASKAAGDIAVSIAPKHYILRTSWVIGDGKNFVRTMVDLANRNISPTVVSDQIGRLTFTSELVKAIDHLLSNTSPYGTYNVSNDGEPVSWADITRKTFHVIGRDDLTVSDTSTVNYYAGKDGIAPRPLKSTLDLAKIQSTGFQSNNWEEELKTYIEGEEK